MLINGADRRLQGIMKEKAAEPGTACSPGFIRYDDAFSTYARVHDTDWELGTLGRTFLWSLDADYDGHSQDLLDAMYKTTIEGRQKDSVRRHAKAGRSILRSKKRRLPEDRFESGQNRPTACPETEHSIGHVE